MNSLYIGCHLSASDGYQAMGKMALKLGANTFAFFTRNPRGGKAKDLDIQDIQALQTIMDENHFGKLVAHAPYTMNLCSDKESIREFGREMLADDLKRMDFLPGNYYNFHPGSHVGQGTEQGIAYIADALNSILYPAMQTTVLLETMAGKGSEVGGTFEELRDIIQSISLKDKIAVCLDTCHVWDGGYHIGENLNQVLEDFDRFIGLDRLKAIHLNDSKNPFAAHKDRHELLGSGFIGEQTLKAVVCHPVFSGLPMILETPNTEAGYAQEIAMVKSWRQEALADK